MTATEKKASKEQMVRRQTKNNMLTRKVALYIVLDTNIIQYAICNTHITMLPDG